MRAEGAAAQCCTHSPWAQRACCFRHAKIWGIPRACSLIPAIIATGKGSFLGSCKMTEIYWEEPGGITTPWPGRTRHRLGVGWVHLSHTPAALPPVPARRCEREGEMKGLDVVALPSDTLRVLPRGTIPPGGWDSSVPAGPQLARRTQRQKWGPGEQRAALMVRAHGALILVL